MVRRVSISSTSNQFYMEDAKVGETNVHPTKCFPFNRTQIATFPLLKRESPNSISHSCTAVPLGLVTVSPYVGDQALKSPNTIADTRSIRQP
ncbi:unnamed protein product [Pieris brassicae]|uniref:Uncharacterized protein n=1 Tax=Pieris brassicae TaxID=7116 RepID=A0A9P0XCE5_PIEBR|nr:unnamed protein product [Pieris brassicae]